MYRGAFPKGPLLDVVRIMHESLKETGIAPYDPGSQGREGSMRALLSDAWDVFWRLRPTRPGRGRGRSRSRWRPVPHGDAADPVDRFFV